MENSILFPLVCFVALLEALSAGCTVIAAGYDNIYVMMAGGLVVGISMSTLLCLMVVEWWERKHREMRVDVVVP
jgi:hypothetical protein